MIRYCSTLQVALRCIKCGKWLKETEAYFFNGDKCTECIMRETEELISNSNNFSKNSSKKPDCSACEENCEDRL